jgi:hypothetical protein
VEIICSVGKMYSNVDTIVLYAAQMCEVEILVWEDQAKFVSCMN